jgi:hypothetical protein
LWVREQLLHQALLVRLEGREFVGFGGDPGVKLGEAVGDSLLLFDLRKFDQRSTQRSVCSRSSQSELSEEQPSQRPPWPCRYSRHWEKNR